MAMGDWNDMITWEETKDGYIVRDISYGATTYIDKSTTPLGYSAPVYSGQYYRYPITPWEKLSDEELNNHAEALLKELERRKNNE